MLDPAISINHLCKKYKNGKLALHNISIEIPYGQAVAILGRNGAGKSTLINILGSILNKTSGEVKICGYDLETQTIQAKGQIGVMIQEPWLDVFLPLEEYLRIYAGYYGRILSSQEVTALLASVDLAGQAKSRPRDLSGGMKRRFCMLKAMVHDPQVILLDEPTAAVDIDLADTIIAMLKKLKHEGKNIILTTHQFHEIDQICDRVIVIEDGQICLDGPTEEVLPQLRNGFKALAQVLLSDTEKQ